MSATHKKQNDKYRMPTSAEIKKWPQWRRVAYAVVPFTMFGLPKTRKDWCDFVLAAAGPVYGQGYINAFNRCERAAKEGLL